MNGSEEIIATLNLARHPEGGYYKEVYRSTEVLEKAALPERFSGARSVSTAIYFLLTSDDFSAFHKIRQDEVWHHYLGSPMVLHVIDASGEYRQKILGTDLANGQEPQLTIPAGNWFGAHVAEPGSFTLMGCTVAPGFDFDDFELADREALINAFPDHREIITKLTD